MWNFAHNSTLFLFSQAQILLVTKPEMAKECRKVSQ